MTSPIGEPARTAVVLALRVTVAAAAGFTVFALLTTQVHGIRAASPWQDDPYDGVVSFTEILVPVLAALIALRALLLRGPSVPDYRADQLLRAAYVCAVLIVATAATDWVAVALRTDRALWNNRTPWLVAALAPVTGAGVVALLEQRRAWRLLPVPPPDDSAGDWLDDAAALAGRYTSGPGPGRVSAFLRRHVMGVSAVLSVAVGLASTTVQAIGERWSSPLLFITAVAVGAGGFFAFCVLCNSALRIAVRRDPRPRDDSRLRRALRTGALAGAVALPAAAVFRDVIWALLGHRGAVHTPGQLAAVSFGAAAVATTAAFGIAVIRMRARRRTNEP